MKAFVNVLLFSLFSLNLFAQTQLSESVTNGFFSVEIASTYIQKQLDNAHSENNYATALGGQFKYETAPFEGFNAVGAFYISQDINFATGEVSNTKQNSELSSTKGNYTELAEAYINYNYKDINLRTGRQVIDTPFANSDPIRMVKNTFEATIATYKSDEFTLVAGKILNWQGYDAGLEKGFTPVGKSGAWLGSVGFSSESIDASIWLYEISDLADIFYTDAGVHLHVSDDSVLHVRAQYISQQELSKSTINAQIYGVLSRLELYGLSINLAYNKAKCDKGKSSFSGFGGGTLYTSMDTMILDNISAQRQSEAFSTALSYDFKNFKLFYALGEFVGKKNYLGEKADIIEQNIGFEYNINNDFQFSAIYVKESDKIDPKNVQNNSNRAQINLTYSFKGKNK